MHEPIVQSSATEDQESLWKLGEGGGGEKGGERRGRGGGGVSIKIKGSFCWKKYEILKVHFKGEDRVFKAPSRNPLSYWRNSLLSFDILKLKFEFIGDELWFVKVKHFKMND